MNDDFSINVYYDENGESLEKIIAYYLILELEKNLSKNIF